MSSELRYVYLLKNLQGTNIGKVHKNSRYVNYKKTNYIIIIINVKTVHPELYS